MCRGEQLRARVGRSRYSERMRILVLVEDAERLYIALSAGGCEVTVKSHSG